MKSKTIERAINLASAEARVYFYISQALESYVYEDYELGMYYHFALLAERDAMQETPGALEAGTCLDRLELML